MDGGSSVNTIFPDNLAKMGISQSRLHPSRIGFHSFLQGYQVHPLKQLDLEVVFADEKNFRSANIRFKVVPFRTSYNAILGWPAYIKFMALPAYAYLQLKIPGPSGMITIRGSPERALKAEVTNVELVKAALASAELEDIKRSVNPTATTLPAKPRPGPALQPVKETKTFHVHPEDPTKTVIIGGDLPEEQEATLLQFLQSN